MIRMKDKKTKHSHIFTPGQQAEFTAFARKCGDKVGTTAELRHEFGLNYTQAYYYRRKAFGYRRGVKLPVQVMVKADVMDLVPYPDAPSRSNAVETAIVEKYGGGKESTAVTRVNLRNLTGY